MRFAGIIAEYDPFHNGHAWQLAQARALGARQVAVAMSCSLTQRGAVPLLPETVRVQAALRCGADFIFALRLRRGGGLCPGGCSASGRCRVRRPCFWGRDSGHRAPDGRCPGACP